VLTHSKVFLLYSLLIDEVTQKVQVIPEIKITQRKKSQTRFLTFAFQEQGSGKNRKRLLRIR
jgi:hypothetical protein